MFPNIPEEVSKCGSMIVPAQDQSNEHSSMNREKAHKPLLAESFWKKKVSFL